MFQVRFVHLSTKTIFFFRYVVRVSDCVEDTFVYSFLNFVKVTKHTKHTARLRFIF